MVWERQRRQPECLGPCHRHGEQKEAPATWAVNQLMEGFYPPPSPTSQINKISKGGGCTLFPNPKMHNLEPLVWKNEVTKQIIESYFIYRDIQIKKTSLEKSEEVKQCSK